MTTPRGRGLKKAPQGGRAGDVEPPKGAEHGNTIALDTRDSTPKRSLLSLSPIAPACTLPPWRFGPHFRIPRGTNTPTRESKRSFPRCGASPEGGLTQSSREGSLDRRSLPASHGQRPWFQAVMTNETRKPNVERGVLCRFGYSSFEHSSFFRHSGFVIRH